MSCSFFASICCHTKYWHLNDPCMMGRRHRTRCEAEEVVWLNTEMSWTPDTAESLFPGSNRQQWSLQQCVVERLPYRGPQRGQLYKIWCSAGKIRKSDSSGKGQSPASIMIHTGYNCSKGEFREIYLYQYSTLFQPSTPLSSLPSIAFHIRCSFQLWW